MSGNVACNECSRSCPKIRCCPSCKRVWYCSRICQRTKEALKHQKVCAKNGGAPPPQPTATANAATPSISPDHESTSSPPLPANLLVRRPVLRFAVGDRVLCCTSNGWEESIVAGTWVFIHGATRPYVCEIVVPTDDDIYASRDTDRCVRKFVPPGLARIIHFIRCGDDGDAINDLLNQCNVDIDVVGEKLLLECARCGNSDVAHYLIEDCNVEVNTVDGKGCNILHLALSNNQPEFVRNVRQYHAELKCQKDNLDRNIMHHTIMSRNQYLLASVLYGNLIDGESLSHWHNIWDLLCFDMKSRDFRHLLRFAEESSAFDLIPVLTQAVETLTLNWALSKCFRLMPSDSRSKAMDTMNETLPLLRDQNISISSCRDPSEYLNCCAYYLCDFCAEGWFIELKFAIDSFRLITKISDPTRFCPLSDGVKEVPQSAIVATIRGPKSQRWEANASVEPTEHKRYMLARESMHSLIQSNYSYVRSWDGKTDFARFLVTKRGEFDTKTNNYPYSDMINYLGTYDDLAITFVEHYIARASGVAVQERIQILEYLLDGEWSDKPRHEVVQPEWFVILGQLHLLQWAVSSGVIELAAPLRSNAHLSKFIEDPVFRTWWLPAGSAIAKHVKFNNEVDRLRVDELLCVLAASWGELYILKWLMEDTGTGCGGGMVQQQRQFVTCCGYDLLNIAVCNDKLEIVIYLTKNDLVNADTNLACCNAIDLGHESVALALLPPYTNIDAFLLDKLRQMDIPSGVQKYFNTGLLQEHVQIILLLIEERAPLSTIWMCMLEAKLNVVEYGYRFSSYEEYVSSETYSVLGNAWFFELYTDISYLTSVNDAIVSISFCAIRHSRTELTRRILYLLVEESSDVRVYLYSCIEYAKLIENQWMVCDLNTCLDTIVDCYEQDQKTLKEEKEKRKKKWNFARLMREADSAALDAVLIEEEAYFGSSAAAEEQYGTFAYVTKVILSGDVPARMLDQGDSITPLDNILWLYKRIPDDIPMSVSEVILIKLVYRERLEEFREFKTFLDSYYQSSPVAFAHVLKRVAMRVLLYLRCSEHDLNSVTTTSSQPEALILLHQLLEWSIQGGADMNICEYHVGSKYPHILLCEVTQTLLYYPHSYLWETMVWLSNQPAVSLDISNASRDAQSDSRDKEMSDLLLFITGSRVNDLGPIKPAGVEQTRLAVFTFILEHPRYEIKNQLFNNLLDNWNDLTISSSCAHQALQWVIALARNGVDVQRTKIDHARNDEKEDPASCSAVDTQLEELKHRQRNTWRLAEFIEAGVGISALQQMVAEGHLDVHNAKDRQRNGLLQVAARCNRADVIKWLHVDYGMDITAKDREGRSVLKLCHQAGSMEAAREIEEIASRALIGNFCFRHYHRRKLLFEARCRRKHRVAAAVCLQRTYRGKTVYNRYHPLIRAAKGSWKAFEHTWGEVMQWLLRMHTSEAIDNASNSNNSNSSSTIMSGVGVRASSLPQQQFSWSVEKEKCDLAIEAAEEEEEQAEGNDAQPPDTQSSLAPELLAPSQEQGEEESSITHALSIENARMIAEGASMNMPATTANTVAHLEAEAPAAGDQQQADAATSALDAEAGKDSDANGDGHRDSAVVVIEYAQDVHTWLGKADIRYRGMFERCADALARGYRSYALSKRLKGCTTPIYEAKLDAGQRILWTKLQRDDSGRIMVWNVAKHDNVSRVMARIDYSCQRSGATTGSSTSTSSSSTLSAITPSDTNTNVDAPAAMTAHWPSLVLSDDSVLLHPSRNVPLKTYVAQASELSLLRSAGWRAPLRLNKRELAVRVRSGSTLLLGRSGTGKTQLLVERMVHDRRELVRHNHVRGESRQLRQVFVTRSVALCEFTKHLYTTQMASACAADGGGDDAAAGGSNVDGVGGREGGGASTSAAGPDEGAVVFMTMEEFLRHLESKQPSSKVNTSSSGSSIRSFSMSKYVDYIRFRDHIYADIAGACKIDALVVWTQIRSYLKGSIEAVMAGGKLPKEVYVDMNRFSRERCRLLRGQREEVYGVFLRYEEARSRAHWWDDMDRVMAVWQPQLSELRAAESEHRKCRAVQLSQENEQEQQEDSELLVNFQRIYVDEVQDSTQAEISLYMLATNYDRDALFLAGDPAQAVVEGVEFRFEEVRSLVYQLSAQSDSLERPTKLLRNYRSHAGILKCAAALLNKMLVMFPGLTKTISPDEGFFNGPRPAYYQGHSKQEVAAMLRQYNRLVVLCLDEQVEMVKKMLDNNNTTSNNNNTNTSSNSSSSSGGARNVVMGIRAAKGLEFRDVALLDVFCSLPDSDKAAWKELLQQGISSSITTSSSSSGGGSNINMTAGSEIQYKSPQLEPQLKLLYTGVTRAVNRLVFIESQRSAIGGLFLRWLKGQDLADKLPNISSRNSSISSSSTQLASTVAAHNIINTSSTNNINNNDTIPESSSSSSFSSSSNAWSVSAMMMMTADEWRAQGIDIAVRAAAQGLQFSVSLKEELEQQEQQQQQQQVNQQQQGVEHAVESGVADRMVRMLEEVIVLLEEAANCFHNANDSRLIAVVNAQQSIYKEHCMLFSNNDKTSSREDIIGSAGEERNEEEEEGGGDGGDDKRGDRGGGGGGTGGRWLSAPEEVALAGVVKKGLRCGLHKEVQQLCLQLMNHDHLSPNTRTYFERHIGRKL